MTEPLIIAALAIGIAAFTAVIVWLGYLATKPWRVIHDKSMPWEEHSDYQPTEKE